MSKSLSAMTHKEVINIAACWLSNRRTTTGLDAKIRCRIILREPTNYLGAYGNENPDILGIWDSNNTVNIEAKVSRSDFFADAKKEHGHPYGHYKLYACPSGLIKPEEIPEKWGLLYVGGNGGRLIVEPKYFDDAQEVGGILANILLNAISANAITIEHLRRKGMWDGKGVIL